jgi:hypothetical protein
MSNRSLEIFDFPSLIGLHDSFSRYQPPQETQHENSQLSLLRELAPQHLLASLHFSCHLFGHSSEHHNVDLNSLGYVFLGPEAREQTVWARGSRFSSAGREGQQIPFVRLSY